MEKTENCEEIRGVIDKITYKNRDNGYTVLRIKVGKELITAVGIMPYLSEGDSAVMYGEYTVHPTYGQQFKADAVETAVPETQAQVLRFLSTGAIKGIGPATARKIVETFREDTLDVIENSPLDLIAIKGISREKALAISEEYKKQYGIRDIMLFLSRFKITPAEAANIFRVLGVASVEIIRSNPYCLCGEGIDFPFDRAEEIAEYFELPEDNTYRLSAGIEYVLRRNLANGHTCLPKGKLLEAASRLLAVSPDRLAEILGDMTGGFRLVAKWIEQEEFIFLPEYAAAEEYTAARLRALVNGSRPLDDVSALELDFLQKDLAITFDEKQIFAVNSAMKSGVFILTGGPGTGKTTTLNAMIRIFENRGFSIALAAPTGRAAKRMTELTGYEAKTLHRLLEVEWGDREQASFARNKRNPLDFDVIIVDEMSMVDTLLFRALLEAVRLTTRILLVGDSDQLPSVGAGNVLNDLIVSGFVPSVKLDKVFRQAAQSAIVTHAHAIIGGQLPDLREKSSDFFFLKRTKPGETCDTVLDLCSSRLPAAYGFSPTENIQVLCPSRKMTAGTVNLNTLLQDKLNPPRDRLPEIYYRGICFRVGDKVMQIKNDYDILWTRDNGETGSGMFNGDIGFIEEIDRRGGIIKVRFDDRVATYYETDLGLLELAYAVTVHKSQGSEFDCVILPLVDTPIPLRYRNLLYTAITRARKMLIVVGDERVFAAMVENDRKTLRYTALGFFLRGEEE